MTLQVIGIVGVVAALLYFWFDYRGAKSNLREARAEITRLEDDLVAEQAVRDAITGRLDEFIAAQELQRERLEALAERQAETRRQIRGLVDDLSSIEIERLVKEQPNEAAAIVVGRFNDLLRMFDDATATTP